MMKKLKVSFEIVIIIAKHEPLYLLFYVPQVLINSLLPLLYVYAPKLIIDSLTEGEFTDTLAVVCVYSALLLVLNVVKNWFGEKIGFLAEKFSRELKFEIGQTAMALELSNVESAEVKDIIGLANNAIGLTIILSIVQNMISTVVSVIGYAVIIIQADWIFLLFVAAVLGLKAIFTFIQFARTKKLRKKFAVLDRQLNYTSNIAFMNEGGAKELRVNGLQDWFMKIVKNVRKNYVTLQYKDGSYRTVTDIILNIVSAAQTLFVLWIISSKYIESAISIADFTLYFTTVGALTAALGSLTDLIGQYNMQMLNAGDYKKLTELRASENNGVSGEAVHFE
ncbi:hypothetical protein FACS1894219_02230 [Clostridia bacterium]|nr:hypothetical protein FACS1894219_02230 [Clostridia bacterium]